MPECGKRAHPAGLAGWAFLFGVDPVDKEPSKKKSRAAYRDELLMRAYEKVSDKLNGTDSGKAIDDLVKLLKADKDLGTDEGDAGEIGLRWEKGKNEGIDE